MEEGGRNHGRISEREILQRQGNRYQDRDNMPVSGEYRKQLLRTQIATSDSMSRKMEDIEPDEFKEATLLIKSILDAFLVL